MRNRKKRNYIIGLTIAVLAAALFQFTSNWMEPAKAADGSVKFVGNSIGGIIPGQFVRITVANLGTSRSPIAFQSKFFDQNGTLVFESALSAVPAGGFGVNDVLFGGLGMDSEVGTGRKQFCVKIAIEGRSVSPSDVSVNAEIVDENTGVTHTHPDVYLFDILIG